VTTDSAIDRRAALGLFARCGIAAVPLGTILTRNTGLLLGSGPGDLQPLLAQVRRLMDAMAFLGEPFSEPERARLERVADLADERSAFAEVEDLLAKRCLLVVRINPESRISVERGPASARLVEHGWRAFLMKVRNEAGVTGRLTAESPQARPVYRPSTGLSMVPRSVSPGDIRDRWLDLDTYGG